MSKEPSTNVSADELNYDHYADGEYDRDIVLSIPFHREIHDSITAFLKATYKPNENINVLELGPGTGLTTAFIRRALPSAHLRLIDFSENMLDMAKKRLGSNNIEYELADYSTSDLEHNAYDLVASVIGLHHQEDPRPLFNKISNSLRLGGHFIFGDLVTYQDKRRAALNDAYHYHHLVENMSGSEDCDEKRLEEWAYHHKYLNQLVPVETLTAWLQECGFSVEQKFLQMNTSLMICSKD